MAMFNRSSNVAFRAMKNTAMNLLTRPSTTPRLLASSRSRSISQNSQNSNNINILNSLRDYWSNLLRSFQSQETELSTVIVEKPADPHPERVHDIEMKNPVNDQGKRIYLHEVDGAEDILSRKAMEVNQEVNQILWEIQSHAPIPTYPRVWSTEDENTRRLVEKEFQLLYEDYLIDLQFEPPKAQPESANLAFAAKILGRRRRQWNVIEEIHQIKNEKLKKKLERRENSKKKKDETYQANFALAQGESLIHLLRKQTSPKKVTPTLNKYGTDMNELARKKKFDPVAGRLSEIHRLIMILGRRRKNNPCLIGEPGVGKTAIIEELAHCIEQRDVPLFLLEKRVISIDMGRVLAGCRFVGMFEERMMHIIEEAKECKDVILFFDEIHMLLGAGSHSKSDTDAADHLKPSLARGELQCIGATTIEEYRKHIMKDAALERRFQPVKVVEPSVEDTIKILRGLQSRYEQHHSVRFTNAALVSAAKLSHHYIRDRFLPDKAIDLMDEAASCVKLRQRQAWKIFGEIPKVDSTVTEDDIQEALSCWIGIPKDNVSIDESERLLRLEETLHASIVGQDEAVTAISDAIRRARAGIRNPHRPIASLIFSGPTGVGKTELAKALAVSYYGSEDAMIRLDMSELMDQNSVNKLVGTHGYGDGGQLTEAVRRCPHSIVLFDEIEKAHSTVFDIMLQIMDAGGLTDGQGRTVDFKNTMLIITSNIGSQVINQSSELNDEDDECQSKVQSLVMEELQKVFRPEFLNRVDQTIVFRQLKLAEVRKIAEMMLKEVSERMIKKKKIVALNLTDRFKDKVVKEGYDPKYGARALRRAIMKLLENNLAGKILAGEIKRGDVVEVDVDETESVVIQASPDSQPLDTAPELVPHTVFEL